MKIVRVEPIIDIGPFSHSKEWEMVKRHIIQAIKSVEWPGNPLRYPIEIIAPCF